MRLRDWRSRLSAWIAGNARRPFRPGEHDCVTFAAGARLAVRGEDLLAPWAGRYRTVEEGFQLAREAGFADPFEGVVQGLAEVPVAQAMIGDLALVEDGTGALAMGVVAGETIVCLGPRGALAHVPLTTARRVWRQ